jgi:hypothetical protein
MPKHDAVADLLGDESPVLGRLARAAGEKPIEQTRKSTDVPHSTAVVEQEAPPPPRRTQSRPAKRLQTARPVMNSSSPEHASKVKRVQVSVEEEYAIDEFLMRIGKEVGTKVQYAQATRAMWSLLLEGEDALDRVSAPQLRRPSNGDAFALADFETAIASYLHDVVRSTKRRKQ